MTILLVLFGLSVLFELSLYLPFLWRHRKVLTSVAYVLTALTSGALVVWSFTLWSFLLFIIGWYRMFNNLRVVEGRMQEGYLRRATLRTSLMLAGLQIGLAFLWALWESCPRPDS
jgi:hypothetical protein